MGGDPSGFRRLARRWPLAGALCALCALSACQPFSPRPGGAPERAAQTAETPHAQRIRRLAALDIAPAQRALGVMLLRGQGGIEPDAREAARWLRLAAERGDPPAAYLLGLMSTRGEGVGKNSAAALHWFQRAASAGHLEAQYMSGLALSSARSSDERGAYVWLWIAGRRGHAKAAARLAALKQRMQPADVLQANREAERMLARFPASLR